MESGEHLKYLPPFLYVDFIFGQTGFLSAALNIHFETESSDLTPLTWKSLWYIFSHPCANLCENKI